MPRRSPVPGRSSRLFRKDLRSAPVCVDVWRWDGARRDAVLLWEAPDAVQQSSHANELEVVRDGACAIAVAVVYAEGGYLVRKRPRHGSGADYLMTRVGDDADNFVRLEVSGTARGDAVELRARLAQKRVQLREGRDPAPGIAVVVAFKDAIVRMEDA